MRASPATATAASGSVTVTDDPAELPVCLTRHPSARMTSRRTVDPVGTA